MRLTAMWRAQSEGHLPGRTHALQQWDVQTLVVAACTGDVFYVIEEGTFTIFDNSGQELARVGKGSCFGELALLREACPVHCCPRRHSGLHAIPPVTKHA